MRVLLYHLNNKGKKKYQKLNYDITKVMNSNMWVLTSPGMFGNVKKENSEG